MDPVSAWKSLEIAKLAVSVLTPVAIVILGFIFNKRLQTLERESQEVKREGFWRLVSLLDFGEERRR